MAWLNKVTGRCKLRTKGEFLRENPKIAIRVFESKTDFAFLYLIPKIDFKLEEPIPRVESVEQT